MAGARAQSHGLIDNFFLTDEELDNSPSRRAGVDADTERRLRAFGCELIQLGVLHMKAPQAVAATGQVLLQRFYCKESLLKYDVKVVACTATFIAGKLEEYQNWSSFSLLRVFDRIDRRQSGRSLDLLKVHTQEHTKMKERLFQTEAVMLRAFGFVLHVEHPHKFVLSLLLLLGFDGTILQEAWNLTNDSLRTTLCVRFKSETVACGIIFMAARRCKVSLPEDRDWCPGSGWWDLCNVPRSDVYAVVRQLADLYVTPRATYVDVRAAAAAAGAVDLSPAQLAHAAAADNSGVGSPDGGGSVRRQAVSADEGGSAPSSLRANGVADGGGGDAPSSGRQDDGDTGGSRSERSAHAEQGGKRDREERAGAVHRDPKRRRDDGSERDRSHQQPSRRLDERGPRDAYRTERGASGRQREGGGGEERRSREGHHRREADGYRDRDGQGVRYRRDGECAGSERGGRERGSGESDGDRRAREDRDYDRSRGSSRGGDVRPPPPDRLKDRLTLPEDRGQKRSRPPSPSRLEAVENGRDRDRPRPAAADKAKPAAEGRQGGQRFAVNLLPEKGAAPRGAEGEQPRDNEARKRSRSPPPAADAEALAGKVAPRSLELGISPPPPGLSPEGSIAPLPAAAGKAANGNVAAEAGRGDHRDRGTGLPAAGGTAGAAMAQSGPDDTPGKLRRQLLDKLEPKNDA